MVTINNTDVSKSLSEVYVILKRLNSDEYQKIPKDIIDYITDNMDNDYIWEYDDNLELEGQDLNEYTLEILTYICLEYILNDEQKNVAKKYFEYNDYLENKNLIKEYKNDIFNNSKNNIGDMSENDLSLIAKEEHNIFFKIKSFILNLFRKHHK